MTRKLHFDDVYARLLDARNVTVDGTCRVEGQLDTVGQMNSYGNVDFWPMGNDMFSFGDPRKIHMKHQMHHINIHNGKLSKGDSECICVTN